MFFILSGTGELRMGSEVYPMRAGDFVACTARGIDTVHQIANTGIEELRYPAVSTTRTPEVYEYPYSGKFGVFARIPASAGGTPRVLMFLGREGQRFGYWDGE